MPWPSIHIYIIDSGLGHYNQCEKDGIILLMQGRSSHFKSVCVCGGGGGAAFRLGGGGGGGGNCQVYFLKGK